MPRGGFRGTLALVSAPRTVEMPTQEVRRAAAPPGTALVRILAVLLAGAVALAFADTSIVMLGLPEMYVELDASILGVSMVATAYNVVVAIGAFALLPVLRRVRPAPVALAGLVIFGITCVMAGVSQDLASIIAWRAGQGLGAAMLLAASLPLLMALTGSDRAGRAWWALAGTAGAALGPAAGGVLTELASWRAIFLAQAPVAALAIGAALVPLARRVAAEGRRPVVGPDARRASAGLVFVFGGLVGALFLAVIMIVTVWRLGPLTGAFVVSALPIVALAVRPVAARLPTAVGAAAGAVVLAAGLTGLALLPDTRVEWAILALAVCGAGFGLAVPPLTRDSVADEGTPAGTASISVGARHVGLVVGLIVIAPLLATQLQQGGDRATLAATAVILDADLPLDQKIPIARDLAAEFDRTPEGAMPDLESVFVVNGAAADLEVAEVSDDLTGAIEDALTGAFRDSYLVAAGIALLALVPVGLGMRGLRRSMVPAAAGVAAAVMVVGGVAMVGVEYADARGELGRAPLHDPCTAREGATAPVDGFDATLQRIALDGLDGAACELGVSREALVLSLAPEDVPGAPDIGWDDETIDRAVRNGLVRAVDTAEDRGEIDGTTAVVLREIARRVPVDEVLGAIDDVQRIIDESGGRFDEAVDEIRSRLEGVDAGDVLDAIGGLIP